MKLEEERRLQYKVRKDCLNQSGKFQLPTMYYGTVGKKDFKQTKEKKFSNGGV